MKQLKRCKICGKRMWPWQSIWDATFHFKCATRMISLQQDIMGILENIKK